jgi:hypothetical protein
MSRIFVRNLSFIIALALPLFIAVPANAQSSGHAASISMDPSVSAPVYDIAKEIKVQGTVGKIEPVGSLAAYVQVQTVGGTVDVHLGASSAVTAESLGLEAGQTVSITGMMATVGANSVLLARILTTPTRIFILRNEHGIPVRSLTPRGSAASAQTVKGGF